MADNQTIIRIAIQTPLRRTFDYILPNNLSQQTLSPGVRIKIPFGSREITGFYLETIETSNVPKNKLKEIIEILDTESLIPQQIMNLCEWASDYYHHAIGDVLATALPKALREGKPLPDKQNTPAHEAQTFCNSNEAFKLNTAQQDAISTIEKSLNHFDCFLLDGITGSGKTEVYLKVIECVLKLGKHALVLIPEIALTPQTLNRFQNRFNVPTVSLHSGLNNTERFKAWVQAKTGEAKIIIGTRSAIFTPCNKLGIIIIDEEHDLSFKQQDGFRYSARDLAIVRANNENIPIVLGSATPSLETLYNVLNNRYQKLSLPERAGIAIHPNFHLIDIRNTHLEQGLSKTLLQMIEKHLEQGNQALLFLNRRGYAPTLMCHTCGWIAKCNRCDVHMTLHQQPAHLHCHHCGSSRKIYDYCPECKNKNLQNVGVGTERLEESLKTYFPDIPIIRIDRDTTRRKNAMTDILNQIHQGHRQILVGTQMIAKGHHFPNVTLAGIINADGGFFSSDFRTTERMGQLLLQVAGRAGRAEKPGEVFIQTHYPEHPLFAELFQHGYTSFAKLMLKERNESQLPPYTYFALLRAQATKQIHPDNFLNQVAKIARTASKNNIKVLGPIPSPLIRKKGLYRSQLLLQTNNRSHLQTLLKTVIEKIELLDETRKVKWSLDVDPLEMY